MKLSKLEKVDLRKAWKHEAYDFTNWLAEEENLELLSEEIGITLQFLETEASVGRYSVDILAEEPHSGRKVIIENQLESTDHDHLGKIITYASGYNAETIIWIVKDVREEHKQAIDWLNDNTNDKINFFAIKLELWKIGNSDIAPKFHIISKPNNWTKAIRSSNNVSKISDTAIFYRDFWQMLKEYFEENNIALKTQTPRPQHWFDYSIGTSKAHIYNSISYQKQKLEIGLLLKGANHKENFDFLYDNFKNESASNIHEEIEWYRIQTYMIKMIG